MEDQKHSVDKMKTAMVESPFNPTEEQIEERASSTDSVQKLQAREQILRENLQYARLLCEHVRQLGYAPFASHLFYPQFLAEDPESRAAGIACRDAWAACADRMFLGMDLGLSRGMIAAAVRPWCSLRLFPVKSIEEVRARLASLPWKEFVEL